jgi:hypothetical protein
VPHFFELYDAPVERSLAFDRKKEARLAGAILASSVMKMFGNTVT